MKQRYSELICKINQWDQEYYVLDDPSESDAEYDRCFTELLAIEAAQPELITAESPSQRVGATPIQDYAKITHQVRMLSLANAFSLAETYAFFEKAAKELGHDSVDFSVYSEPKLDGLAISIYYENGKFVYAATRGDGQMGEDVSHTIKTIKSIPLKLNSPNPPKHLDIRGEVFMPKQAFEKLNRLATSNHTKIFVSCYV